MVEWPSDLYEDPQLSHRGFFVTLNHSIMGPTPYDGLVTKFSDGTARLRRAAPAIGEHTHYVLSEILDRPDEEITEGAGRGGVAVGSETSDKHHLNCAHRTHREGLERWVTARCAAR